MIILDAIVAGLLFKIFDKDALTVLMLVCCVNYLRQSGFIAYTLSSIEDNITKHDEFEEEEEFYER